MSGMLQVDHQYWKCQLTGTQVSLMKYCFKKTPSLLGMISMYDCLGNCLSELAPMVSISTPTCTLWHDDYVLVHITIVLNKLKYCVARDPLETFY